MEIIDLKDDYISFYLNGVDTMIANTLRRILLSEIETMAIDLVDIRDNSSCLLDNLLADRISLIPIRVTDLNDYKYSEECDCEFYCDKCSIKLELNVENKNPGYRAVTSKDIIAPNGVSIFHGNSGNGILLVKLRQGQRIDLTCIARKDTAKNHTKWSPVCKLVYNNAPIVELKKIELTDDEKMAMVKVCPRNVFTITNNELDIEDMNRCILCRQCIKLNKDAVDVQINLNKFFFSFETVGQLDAATIILIAFKVLKIKKKL